MGPVCLSIQQEATGKRMGAMIREKGYSVKDIQEAMGFENPQAVYKWLSGKSLPSLDNFLILSRILNTSIDDILIVDGDIAASEGLSLKKSQICQSASEYLTYIASVGGGEITIEIRHEDENIWLAQKTMALLLSV